MELVSTPSCQYYNTHSICAPHFLGLHDMLLCVLIIMWNVIFYDLTDNFSHSLASYSLSSSVLSLSELGLCCRCGFNQDRHHKTVSCATHNSNNPCQWYPCLLNPGYPSYCCAIGKRKTSFYRWLLRQLSRMAVRCKYCHWWTESSNYCSTSVVLLNRTLSIMIVWRMSSIIMVSLF